MSCSYSADHLEKYAELLIADDNCQETLQVLSLSYLSLKSNTLCDFHMLHTVCIVRNLYTIESTEKLYKPIKD